MITAITISETLIITPDSSKLNLEVINVKIFKNEAQNLCR